MSETRMAWKMLDPCGCTYYQEKPQAYALPAPGEEWGPWTEHPEPGDPDGKDCGPGGYHFMLRPDWRYAPLRAWPWMAEVRGVLGESETKLRAVAYRLKRVLPNELWRWVRENGLSGAKLSRANLSRAHLSWANLSGADLYEANLSRAHLYGADLYEANLSRAHLSDADLYEANLYKANLSRANLSWADLSGADLSRANLSWANLSGADLSRANLSRAHLSDADLYEAVGDSFCGRIVGGRLVK